MNIAVLAVQGSFIEHEKKLAHLGVSSLELRQRSDLDRDFSGLILPGGESTVQGKLLQELEMLIPLRERIRNGLPVLATCAGLILLAEHLCNDEHVWLGTMPVTVRRNAYGRQLGSFHTEARFADLGSVPMTFIRAPYIEAISAPSVSTHFAQGETETEILATVEDKIVAVRSGRQIGLSFHPELDPDDRIHAFFLQKCMTQV